MAKGTILVVDDEKEIRDLINSCLKLKDNIMTSRPVFECFSNLNYCTLDKKGGINRRLNS